MQPAFDYTAHYRTLELDKILLMLADECSTDDIAELALAITPTSKLTEAKYLLSQTSDAHMLMARFGSPSFSGLKNIISSATRANSGGALSMRELLDISVFFRTVSKLNEWRDTGSSVKTVIDTMFHSLTPNKFLENLINSAIVSDEEMSDNASPELSNIRRKIRNASSKVKDQLDRIIKSANNQKYLQESIVTIRSDRYVVPVKAEFRSEIPGLVHDTSSSGSTIFIEPLTVVETNNELRLLKAREKTEIDRILSELSSHVASFYDNIKLSFDLGLKLGLIFAKASFAYKLKATVPLLNDKKQINLKAARHPLINPQHVVPTDINLGIDFDALIITGPNTGGKTVALKTLGLLTLMSMCGLMIPANENSSVSVFDYVLADIGDEQSIEQSLSTFSSHMVNISKILEIANEKSLILLDELGAGTDPVEGAALAMSILENLRSKGAKIATTTHYAELKAFALQTPGVENGSCEFDVNSLRPTYRLLIGLPGRSNAFAISSRLGISDEIIDHAKKLVSSDNKRFEDVVSKLEQSRINFELREKQAEELKAAAEAAAEKALEQQQYLEKQRETELERAKKQAMLIIDKARRDAHALIDELDDIRHKQDKENFAALAQKAKASLNSRVNQMENDADPIKKQKGDKYVLPRPLKVDDTVLIFDIDKKATVLSLPDKSGNVEVLAGIIKTRIKLDNLRLIESSHIKTPANFPTTRNVTSNANASVKTEINLRGKMVDESILDLDNFIDSSVLMGINEVTIIHGKGTGALRKGIHTHLRNHPSVKNFRLGVFGEGESGVTIVNLK